MVFLITPSTICKRLKIQLLALSLVVSIHHSSFRFLNLCVGYLLTTILILRFVASLIMRCLYMNLIILVRCSAFDQILILFVLPLLAHYYYHTSKFSIVHLNIRGLLGTSFSRDDHPMNIQKKIDYIRYAVKLEHSPTILCITETKLG